MMQIQTIINNNKTECVKKRTNTKVKVTFPVLVRFLNNLLISQSKNTKVMQLLWLDDLALR